MENTNETIVSKKDPWKAASMEFTHLSYFLVAFFLIGIVLVVTKSDPYLIFTKLSFIKIIVSSSIWFYLGRLFKKHNKSAVNIGYIICSVFTVFCLFPSPNILGILVGVYFFWRIYNVSKVSA